jgi:Na+/H+-dicarboxylate symporter
VLNKRFYIFQLRASLLFFLILLTRTHVKIEQIKRSQTEYQTIEQVIGLLFDSVIRILHWVIALVPIAVFGIVSKTLAINGFEPFKSLAAFAMAVLLALFLQAIYYLIRLKFGFWVSPQKFLQGGPMP